eukprot:11202998-Lingulodinium_polyedra.AAC.1
MQAIVPDSGRVFSAPVQHVRRRLQARRGDVEFSASGVPAATRARARAFALSVAQSVSERRGGEHD